MKKILHLDDQAQLCIRTAIKADAANIIQYVKTVADETDFLTFSSDEFHKTLAEEEDIIESYQGAENKVFVVAELSETIVGLLSVEASPKPRLQHIGEFGISVLKKHWYKGIGTELIQFMIEWAKASKKIRKLNLRVMYDNESAIHLYQKMGFEIEGLITRDLFVNDEFFDAYQMGLLID